MLEFKVMDLINPEKKLISRHPYWLREGYVEEIYAENS